MNAMLAGSRESETALTADIDKRLGELRPALAGAPSGSAVTVSVTLYAPTNMSFQGLVPSVRRNFESV